MYVHERLTKYLEEGVKTGRLSEEEYRALLEALERAGKITTIHPELYKGFLDDALHVLPAMAEKVRSHKDDMKKALKGAGLETIQVNKDESMMDIEALASDASSCPVPVAMAYVALVGAIALREPRRTPPKIARELIVENSASMGGRSFKFYYQVIAESLIPVTCISQIKEYGGAQVLVVDGPLSASELLRRVPKGRGVTKDAHRRIQKAAHGLIKLRDNLASLCRKENIVLLSVVKRCTSRHFLAWYDLKGDIPYVDQYVFQQILRYGERTESIPITDAIEKQGARHFPRYSKIYGFYIKTSRNPLTPPVRVEYPEYLKGEEDWIASYVLSTALTSIEAEYDGLPKVQCLAHRDVRIAERVMREIYRRVVIKILDEGLDVSLLGSKWGFSLAE